MKIDLNEIVDPFGARVVVRVDAGVTPRTRGSTSWACRCVDALLVGQPVTHAPTVVERLCGICPAAHHLAGVRALEALAGQGPVPPTADAVRRLLHLGSALETHAVRFVGVDREAAVTVRRAGRAAMAASGSPGHFPATAVPGGVRAAVDPEALAGLRGQVADAVAAARAVADALASDPESATTSRARTSRSWTPRASGFAGSGCGRWRRTAGCSSRRERRRSGRGWWPRSVQGRWRRGLT